MRLLPTVLILAAGAAGAAELEPVAHGFVSFGAISTPGVDWVGESHGVSTDFYEAALNAVVTPMPDVRAGAQIFTRNFLGEDAGRVALDWATVDWRPDDRFGLAIGRVKLPIGLYNESLDIDTARTAVFLPRAIYALNSRDLFIAHDGVKVYGLLACGGLGDLEYALTVGRSHLSTEGGFAAYLRKSGLGDPIRDLQVRMGTVAMLHWHTPVDGLAFRITGAQLRGLHVNGAMPGGVSLDTDVGLYDYVVASMLWERGDWTVAVETQRTHGIYELAAYLGGAMVSSSSESDNNEGGYLSTTWSATRRLDLYAALSHQIDDVAGTGSTTTGWTAAMRYDISGHWLVKGEFQQMRGTNSLVASENPDGLPNVWRILAVKTTVDF